MNPFKHQTPGTDLQAELRFSAPRPAQERPSSASPRPGLPWGADSDNSTNSAGVSPQPSPGARSHAQAGAPVTTGQENIPASGGCGPGADYPIHAPAATARSREHPIPEDSILASYRDFVRDISELPDALIVAPVLALCGKLLTPRVTLDFGGSKPMTIFNFVVARAGLRKSTTFGPAEKIARSILMSDDLISGNASDSALFDTFEAEPHRLQFEDEGNTILRSWESNTYGREVSARYLRLYDGAPWDQNFLREMKNHEDGKAARHIPQATLSLCIGATFGVARLDQLESGSGLRRRFGFYLANSQERTIVWPRSMMDGELDQLANLFDNLRHLQGTVGMRSLTAPALEYWTGLQKRNRERCMSIPGYTNAGEDLLSSLNESPARCLKLAVIFQACRWANGKTEHPLVITPEMLELAEAHQNACLDALVELEGASRRAVVEDTAEWLLAQIAGDHALTHGPQVLHVATYTRTELTRRFAANPGRTGALTTSRLYGEIIPRLIAMGRCRQVCKVGRQVTFSFTWD